MPNWKGTATLLFPSFLTHQSLELNGIIISQIQSRNVDSDILRKILIYIIIFKKTIKMASNVIM